MSYLVAGDFVEQVKRGLFIQLSGPEPHWLRRKARRVWREALANFLAGRGLRPKDWSVTTVKPKDWRKPVTLLP